MIILLFGFLIFGPEKLPAIAKTVGKGIAKFRAAQQDMSEVLKESDAFDPNSDEPFKDPTETIDKLASTAEKHMRSAVSDTTTAVKNKTHDNAAKPAVSVPSVSSAPKQTSSAVSGGNVKSESFTERKARYERERAAKMAAAAAEAASVEAADSGNSSKTAEAASVEAADSGQSPKAAAAETLDSGQPPKEPAADSVPQAVQPAAADGGQPSETEAAPTYEGGEQ